MSATSGLCKRIFKVVVFAYALTDFGDGLTLVRVIPNELGKYLSRGGTTKVSLKTEGGLGDPNPTNGWARINAYLASCMRWPCFRQNPRI
ncbi:hypothetical protein J6590_092150 [Homalodisca vitripennis]|nr:hypothetical protein J6590_092150 [Homalodisca vitripennis]